MTDGDLVALDATAQADMVRSRAISARALTEATLRRVGELQPTVNAYRVVMAEEALAEADRIDSLPDVERAMLAMAGVPVAIKDDTDVAGQITAWGSAVDRGRCAHDAEVVRRLRAAGATIIGKTNVSELTLWPWTASDRWGVTRNPWNLGRTPGGSSGGSAAAVCAGMAAVALGSDGGGSVRYPAGLTGLVGVKPQRDRIPVGPEHGSAWHGLLGLGSLTRSVRDAALFLDVTTGEQGGTGFRGVLNCQTRRLRIAVSTNPPPGTQASLSPTGRRAIDQAVALLTELGHQVFEVDLDYGLGSLWNATVRLLKGVGNDVAAMPNRSGLEARTRSVARLSPLLPARSLKKALLREHGIAESINAVFGSADVVLTPLCGSSAPRLDQCPTTGALRSLRASNTSAWLVPWNVTGQPAVSIPIGTDDDSLPTAIQLAGRANDEGTLLSLASQIEETHPFPRWSPPTTPTSG